MSGSLLAGTPPADQISFTEVPSGLLVPGAYVEIAPNYSRAGLVPYAARALLLIPRLNADAIPALTPTPIVSLPQALSLFAPGSIGRRMVRNWLAGNPWIKADVMTVGAASGSASASYTITPTIASALTGNFTLAVYVAGVRYGINVASATDTAVTIGQAIAAAINADLDCPLDASASGTTGVVTLTSPTGTAALSNYIDVRIAALPSDALPSMYGLTVAVAQTASGTGVPNVANALASVATTAYTDIVLPWTDATTLAAVTTELDRRYNAMTRLDAMAWCAISASTITALTTLSSAQNSRFVTCMAFLNGLTPPWEVAASYAGAGTFALVDNPARQLRTIALPNVRAPAIADQPYEQERQTLLAAGLSTFTCDDDGTVRIDRAVTFYTMAATNVPDGAWRDVMTPRTLSRIRYDWVSFAQLQYPRAQLAGDGDPAAAYNGDIATPRKVHSSWGARCALYEQLGWIQDAKDTVAASTFVINASDKNRLDARLQVNLTGNLMILAARLEFGV